MTEKSAAPEKKPKIWRDPALCFPVAAIAIVACGVGFFAAYARGYFTNNSIFEIFFYMLFWYGALCVSLIYILHYLVAGIDERNGWGIGKSALLCVTLFLGIFGMVDAYSKKPLLIGIDKPITLEALLGGILALWGLFFLGQRTKNQQREIEIQGRALQFQASGLEIQAKELETKREEMSAQSNKETEGRFDTAIALLGNDEASARTGAIYSLYELAKGSNKYREQIAQILCSHICSKTQEEKYQKEHMERPSSEIQTAIDILFKNNGLYCQDFARENPYFPRAKLSRAYLNGANFASAQCQRADFSFAQCENVNFNRAQCQRAIFRAAQCRKASFMEAQCQRADFSFAKCYSATFANAHCYKANFTSAQCAGASFFFARCYEAKFQSAQCQDTGFSHAECQGAYFGEAGCQFANFRSAKCQGANFFFTAFQSASFNEKTDFCGAYSDYPSDFLEDRIGQATEVVKAIFEGELSKESVNAIEEAKPYAPDEWYQKMQNLINENKGKPEFCIVPDRIVTGVLEDSEEIREIAAEIRKWER